MREHFVKIQHRKISAFVTIPIEYKDKIKDVTHMKVTENDFGNLEYEAVRNEGKENDKKQEE